ncbi:hypothetical protein BWI75_15555 [Gloeocapsopsis sp. AAB1 = 1H9]|uniref:Uncharacterized protein n=1 Tax=Gloeocapsopsis dulcis AAB1 = 1H9 TaxID=1433147 RepID=A0A6N8FY58_9CHRO|nr:hypothetical protein [Gloeocapsopsis dulcis AAB1 = 1H9]
MPIAIKLENVNAVVTEKAHFTPQYLFKSIHRYTDFWEIVSKFAKEFSLFFADPLVVLVKSYRLLLLILYRNITRI